MGCSKIESWHEMVERKLKLFCERLISSSFPESGSGSFVVVVYWVYNVEDLV